MTCDIVREATKKVLEDIENAKDAEKNRILRHIRSCPECRTCMSREERDNVVSAIVHSFE
jgi:predicted anti-sigma-YlaC factor YlaD